MKTMIARAILLISLCSIGATTQPTTKPVKPFDGITPILRQVPESAYPADGKGWTDLKAEFANSILAKDIGQPVIVSFTVKEVGHGFGNNNSRTDDWKNSRGEYWVKTGAVKMNTWSVSLMCYFGDDQKDKLAKLNAGDSVRVKGNIVRCEFYQYPSGWAFCVDLGLSEVME